mmetsp:Transcript_15328/g.41834  ORF Transcript_15328/g.41834 Transcript_15328/m.41834 type:complete len:309 (+) Transcript_15328:435-1361(+)
MGHALLLLPNEGRVLGGDEITSADDIRLDPVIGYVVAVLPDVAWLWGVLLKVPQRRHAHPLGTLVVGGLYELLDDVGHAARRPLLPVVHLLPAVKVLDAQAHRRVPRLPQHLRRGVLGLHPCLTALVVGDLGDQDGVRRSVRLEEAVRKHLVVEHVPEPGPLLLADPIGSVGGPLHQILRRDGVHDGLGGVHRGQAVAIGGSLALNRRRVAQEEPIQLERVLRDPEPVLWVEEPHERDGRVEGKEETVHAEDHGRHHRREVVERQAVLGVWLASWSDALGEADHAVAHCARPELLGQHHVPLQVSVHL